MAKSKKDTEKEDKLIQEYRDLFQLSVEHDSWVAYRENAREACDYVEGEQWTAAEKKALKSRKQPDTVNNQLKVIIDRLTGQLAKSKTKIVYEGKTAKDEPLAEIYSALATHVKEENDASYEFKDMARDGFITGFGVLEAGVEYDENPPFRAKIKIGHVDCFDIFPDPYSKRYDWNKDARFVCRAKWLELEEAKSLYPDKATELEQAHSDFTVHTEDDSNSSYKKDLPLYFDKNYKRVRIVQVWRKVKEKQTWVRTSNGFKNATDLGEKELEKFTSQFPDVEVFRRTVDQMKLGIFAGNILLREETNSPYDHNLFPYIPYYFYRKKNGEPYSVVKIAIPMQDAINKRESKASHLLNVNQVLKEQGAIPDPVEFAKEMAKPDGQPEVAKGALTNGRLQVTTNLDLAQTQMSFHVQAMRDMRLVTGFNPEALAERSEIRSGVGIARKQAAADIVITEPFNNLKRSSKILGRVILHLLNQFYDKEMVFSITDELKNVKRYEVNTTEYNTLRKNVEMDVVIKDVRDSSTMQEEQFDLLAQYLPKIVAMGPVWARIFIQASNLRNKEELLTTIENAGKAPPERPKMSLSLTWDNLQPFEKAHFAAMMGNPKLAGMEMKAGGKPDADSAKNQMDLKKKQMDIVYTAKKNELDLTKHKVELAAHAKKKNLEILEKVSAGNSDLA